MATSHLRRCGLLGSPLMFLLNLLTATTTQAQTANTTSMAMTSSATATATAAAATKTIIVGFDGHAFSPNMTEANTGDTIEFNFYPGNHSVVRSEYMFPCVPYETTGNGKTGFFSGFYNVAAQSTTPKWRYTISDTNPIYFYSSGPDDCNKYGMVGVINANQEQLQMQFDMALDSGSVVQPSAAFSNVPSSTPPTSTSSSTPTATPTSSTTSQPATSATPSLSGGSIAGIAIGGFIALALLGAIFFWVGRSSRRRSRPSTPTQVTQPPAAPMSQQYTGSGAGFGSEGRNTSPMLPTGVMETSPSPGPIVDGDTIYVPVKRSAIVSGGDFGAMGWSPPANETSFPDVDARSGHAGAAGSSSPTMQMDTGYGLSGSNMYPYGNQETGHASRHSLGGYRHSGGHRNQGPSELGG